MITNQTIEKLKQKDEEAFDKIYLEYHALVFYCILKIVKNREDAIEIEIDTFVKMYNKIDQYKGGNFKYWLLQIAKNTAINFVNKNKNRAIKLEEVQIEDQDELENESEDFSLGIYDDLLKNNFDEFTYQIFVMKIIYQYTFDELAEELNQSRSKIYRTYKSALEKLKKLVKEEKNK